MDRSGSQKFLLVISILDVIFGVLAVIVSLMAIVGAGVLAGGVAVEAGLSVEEAGTAGGLMTTAGVIMLIAGAVSILTGVLGIRAANDNQKIMPVWVLALIQLIFGVVSVIMTFVQGGVFNDILTAVISLALAALMFWVANNIKQQAGR